MSRADSVDVEACYVLLCNVMQCCAQGDLGLNICEAHAFNTKDKFVLDVFVINGWTGGVSRARVATAAPQQPHCSVWRGFLPGVLQPLHVACSGA